MSETLSNMCQAVYSNNDIPAFDALLGDKMTDIKTVKNGGNAKATNNATFIIRLAKDMGIEHPRITKYYAKLNSNGKKNTTGINPVTDRVAVLEVFKKIGQVSKFGFKAMFDTAMNYALKYVEEEEEEEEVEDEIVFDMSSATPSLTSSIDDDPDFDDDEEEEEETADVTETSFVLDEWSVSVKRTIQNVTDEEIAQAKAVLHKTNKNGDGYEMTLSGKKEINPSSLAKVIDWDIQLLKAAADILCIAPKRNKKWSDENGRVYKSRSWFPELCNAGNYQAAKKFTLQMAAYVVLQSKRNFWTARFAWSVSPSFKDTFRAFIGINEEVADSPVIGGQAQSWHWPLVKNDWTPTSSGKMTVEDYNNLDISSLDSL